MLKDRQEILAVGEFALFLATWVAVILGAVNHYRHQEHNVRGDSVASYRGTVSDETSRE